MLSRPKSLSEIAPLHSLEKDRHFHRKRIKEKNQAFNLTNTSV